MILRSILFRLAQFLAGCLGLYFLLMAGTLLLQNDHAGAIGFGSASVAAWFVWGLLTLLISRRGDEMIRETAMVVYPVSALIALALGIYLGLHLEALIETPRHQSWTLIFAGVLLAGVMAIRCLDIRWMRNAADLRDIE